MQVSFDSQPAPGQPVNEDLAMAAPRFAFVLDGATAAEGVDTGCQHTVAWFVARLGGELARLLAHDDDTSPADSLADTLAAAITGVRGLHSITCDLDNPSSPSSTVAILRERPDSVDYLVLADSPVVIRDRDGLVTTVHDDRNDHLPDYTPEAVRDHRNVEGGFWVAGTNPEAAHEALTGSLPHDSISTAGIFSDGTSRLVERHGLGWAELLDLLETHGPSQVIAEVRQADADVEPGTYQGKSHDDATALLCRFRLASDHPATD